MNIIDLRYGVLWGLYLILYILSIYYLNNCGRKCDEGP